MPKLIWRLVNGNDLISRAIDHIEDTGSVCHVEFIVDGQTIGARANGGVARRSLDYEKITVIKMYEAECTDGQYNAAMNFLEAQIGKPYDYMADIGVLLDRDWRTEDHWMCSELWARVMEIGGLIKGIDANVNQITPEEALILSSAMFTLVEDKG